MTTLYLVRHGQTAHNRDGLGLGREDAPLTELGEAQAQELGRRFEGVALDAVFTSPLGRASSVAKAIAAWSGLAPIPREELIELDVGDTEGLTFAAMREQYPEFMREWAAEDPTGVRMPGGERLLDVARRTEPLVAELRQMDAQGIVLVSHNFVIKVMLCQLLDVPITNFRRFQVDIASVSTMVVRGGRVAVQSLNDICHVGTLNLAPSERSVKM